MGDRATIRVADLARHKGLSAEWLARRFGLRDDSRGVVIPYWDVTGQIVAEKRRTHLIARDGSWWPRNLPLYPYGAWQRCWGLTCYRLLLVEGESDVWALFRANLKSLGASVLGMPGSGSASCLAIEHVEPVEEIFIHQEPGQGGEAFVAGVLDRLRDLRWSGKVWGWTSGPHVKDPSDLYRSDPAGFCSTLQRRLDAARSLEVPPPLPDLVAREVARRFDRLVREEMPDAVSVAVEKVIKKILTEGQGHDTTQDAG